MLSASLTKPALAAGILLSAGLLLAVGVGGHALSGQSNAPPDVAENQADIHTVADAATPLTGADLLAGADKDDADVAVPMPLPGAAGNTKITPAVQKLREALAESTEVEFVDMRLIDAMEFLSDLHNITIIMDQTALKAEGIPSDKPITLTFSGISLKSGLTLILKPLGLTYLIEDDVLKVTSQAAVEKRQQAKRGRAADALTAQKMIRKALSETTTLDFLDTPLREALRTIQKQHHVNIHLDMKALFEEGIDQDEKISVALSGVRLESALKIILTPLGLTYVVEEETLRITSHNAVPPVDLKPRSQAEKKIEEALAETTTIEFIDTGLKDALEFIADRHKITILLDETALNEEGINTDEPVTQVLSDFRLKSVLNIILDPLGVTWVIENDVMKITSRIAADKRKETRVYSVKSLLNAGYEMEELKRVVEQHHDASAAAERLPYSRHELKRLLKQHPELTVETLLKSVVKQPAAKPQAETLPGVLVVTQSQPQHRRTIELLEQLHRAAELAAPAAK